MSKVSEYPGLAERIYDLRRQAGWSRASLSRKMNELGHVHWQQGTVANIENGIRYLRLYEGFAMAKIFLVDIYELAYGLEGEKTLLVFSAVEKLRIERELAYARVLELDKMLGFYDSPLRRHG